VVRLITAPEAQVTWHGAYHNKKGRRGEFFEVRSGKHWVMLSVSNVRPKRPELWRYFDWDDPDLARRIDDLLKKV
jgi:hypothetical protein